MHRSTLAWILVCGVVVGCGGGGGPEVGVNEDNLCSEAAEVLCFDIYNCCTEGEIENILGVDEPRTEAQCRDDMTVACERGIAQLRWSIEQGRVELEADILDACLEALIAPDDTCAVVAAVAPWAEACAISAWTGTVAEGADCYYDYECAGEGSYCTSSRVCEALPGDGDPCPDFVCATGFYCQGGTCDARLGTGSPCTSAQQCQEDLYCDFNLPTPACAARQAVGESCTSSNQCETFLCLPGSCEASGFTCYEDNDCSGACEDDGSFCFDDADCGLGTCSLSATTCFDNFDCTGGVGDTCVFTVACLPGNCLGDPVCAENFQTYDYCEDVANGIPL